MRTWVKVSIIGVALLVLGFSALAGTGGYFVLRHLETGTASEADAQRQFEAVRSQFGSRLPLIEVVDPRAADIRIHRPEHPDGRPISTFHVLTWNAENRELLRTEAPVWLMRFSSINVLSQLGIAPERFRLTVKDIEDYGPGIVIDYNRPGQGRGIVWVE